MRWALFLLVTVGFAGCSESVAPGSEAPPLTWDTVEISTTPLEPFEFQGAIVAAWSNSLYGLWVENEDDMARHYIRDGDTWYSTQQGMGWLRYDGQEALEASSTRSFRILVWDLPAVLEGSDVDVEETALTASLQMAYKGRVDDITIDAIIEDGALASGQIYTGLDPESPYTFTRGGALPFGLEVPAASRPVDDVFQRDQTTQERHVIIKKWIDDYVTANGRTPPTVDEDVLLLQRLGADWPSNPYSDKPMANREASGDYLWLRCSDADASYVGHGWDGTIYATSYGAGCTA